MSTFAESFSRLTDLIRHQPSENGYTAYIVPNKATGTNSDSEIAAPHRGGRRHPDSVSKAATSSQILSAEDFWLAVRQTVRAATRNQRGSRMCDNLTQRQSGFHPEEV
jgi:hypothetical protein